MSTRESKIIGVSSKLNKGKNFQTHLRMFLKILKMKPSEVEKRRVKRF